MTKSDAGRLGGLAGRSHILKRHAVFVAAYERAPKKCRECGSVISFEKRMNEFCGHPCAAIYNNVRNGKKRRSVDDRRLTCAACYKELRGIQKVYCSRQCQKDKAHKRFIEGWLAGKIDGCLGGCGRVSGHIRRYLIKLRGERCEQCGWEERNPVTGRVPITVDHVDGKWQNTREINLRLLCPNCHSLTPTFQALNRGNGHPARRASYRSRCERNGSAVAP
jgi:hypothetical protein